MQKQHKQSKKKIILRYVLLALAAVLIGVNFQALVTSKLTRNAVPMPFGVGVSVVLSGSMEPVLSTGDLIVIKEYGEYQEPQTGEVIVYQSSSEAIVHRIISVDGDTVITQGDANNVADEPFSLSAVKGKVILSIPILGYVVLFLKTPWGIILVLGLAIFLMEQSFQRDKKQKEEGLEAMKAEIKELLEEQKREENSK